MRLRKRAYVAVGVALSTIAFAGAGPASAAFNLGRLAGVPVATSSVAPTIEPWLVDELARAGTTGALVEVLVGATSADAAEAAIEAVGLEPRITFEKVGFAATRGTAAQVQAIATKPGVTHLQGNRPLAPTNTTATVATRVAEAEDDFTVTGGGELDGSGVGIAVVDSGMAGDHPMFLNAAGTKTRLLNIKQLCANIFECAANAGAEADEYFVDMTGLDTDAMAAGGHGTHVTSIAGGREVVTSSGVAVRGVARNASLYGLGAGLGIFALNAAASLNWVLEHHADPCGAFTPAPDVAGGCAPIKVVNNSYGSPGEYDPANFFSMVSERLALEGVTVVWAAGNGDELTSTDPQPNDGSVNLSNPHGQSPKGGVLMVANYDDRDRGVRNNKLNDTSSRGEEGRPETYPDLSAPGTNILAACRPYLPICTSFNDDLNFGAITGTSMAAPHVAGIVALLVQKDPTLTPAQIENLLEDTAYKFGAASSYEDDTATASAPIPAQVRNDTTTSFDKGHGLVDLAAALYSLASGTDPGMDTSYLPCGTGSMSSFTDPSGDATEFVLVDTNVGPLSYPGLDVVEASIAPQPSGDVKFTIEVDDLTDLVAPGASGDLFRFNFTFDGRDYELDLERNVNGPPGTFAYDFRLFQNGLTEDVDIALGLTGGFDTANDEIWALVPDDAIQNVYPTSPLLATGQTVDGVSVLGQRLEVVVTPTVDSAVTPCVLTLP